MTAYDASLRLSRGPTVWGLARASEALGRRPLGYTACASVLLVAAARFLTPNWAWCAIACAVVACSWAVARRVAPGTPLPWIVLAASALRVALTAAIFFISLRSGHNGILFFSVDSYVYDRWAISLSQGWLNHDVIVFIDAAVLYPLLNGVLYLLLGPASLHVTLLNTLLAGLGMTLAYRIGRRLRDDRAGLLAAGLVGFLPSSVLWSSQLLKETLILTLALWAVDILSVSLAGAQGGPSQAARRGWGSALARSCRTALPIAAVAVLRFYTAYALVGAALLAFGLLALRRLWQRNLRGAAQAALVVPLAVVLTLVSRQADYVLRVMLDNERLQAGMNLVPDDAEMNRYQFDVRNLPPAGNPLTAAAAVGSSFWSYATKPYHGENAALAQLLNGSLDDNGATITVAGLPHLASTGLSGADTLMETRRRLAEMFGDFDPETLNSRRRSFARGHSVIDPGVDISYVAGLLGYLPKGLLEAYLAPFPWEWLDFRGNTGYFKAGAAVEVLLFYMLLPSVCLGLAAVWRSRSLPGLLLVAYAFFTSVPVALIVANLGTLFRLRVMFLAPLLILATVGGFPRLRRSG